MAKLLVVAGFLMTVGVTAAAIDTGEGKRKPGLVRVVSGLDEPVYALGAPGGAPERYYVVERKGRIRIVDSGRVLPTSFVDLGGLVNTVGYRGLLSMVFHPRFPADPRFFVHYVGLDNDAYVDELRVRNGAPCLPPAGPCCGRTCHPGGPDHYGGQVAFGPDGRLYASFGEATDGPAAQRSGTFLGKLVRIAVDRPGAQAEIVAYGLRNPWRFSFDTATGDIYIGDVGESLREEVDRLPRGFRGIPNFGWNIFEGRVRHRADPGAVVGTVAAALRRIPDAEGPLRLSRRRLRLPRPAGALASRPVRLRGSLRRRLERAGSRRQGSGHRSEPLSLGREPLVSFGRTAGGELLLVGLGGNVYRVEER